MRRMTREEKKEATRPGAGCSIVYSTRRVKQYTRRLSALERRQARRRKVLSVAICFVVLTFVCFDEGRGLIDAVLRGGQATALLGIAWFCCWLLDDWKEWKEFHPVEQAAIRRVYRARRGEERRPGDLF